MRYDCIILEPMKRETDFTHPNPPDDVPSPLMQQAASAFMLPWPRKPLSGKPKPVGKVAAKGKQSKSGLHKLKRTSHPNPYF